MSTIEKIDLIYGYIKSINDEPSDNPGISETEIIKHFNSKKLTPILELIQLYQWHNGICNLDAFLNFLTIDEAIYRYELNKDLKDETPEFKWNENWFTVLDINGDVQICLDLGTKELYSVDVECDLVEKIADNYKTYIDAILSLFESGNYTFDEEAGCIDVKDEIWNDISQQYKIRSA